MHAPRPNQTVLCVIALMPFVVRDPPSTKPPRWHNEKSLSRFNCVAYISHTPPHKQTVMCVIALMPFVIRDPPTSKPPRWHNEKSVSRFNNRGIQYACPLWTWGITIMCYTGFPLPPGRLGWVQWSELELSVPSILQVQRGSKVA
jgi:hypothetical protein